RAPATTTPGPAPPRRTSLRSAPRPARPPPAPPAHRNAAGRRPGTADFDDRPGGPLRVRDPASPGPDRGGPGDARGPVGWGRWRGPGSPLAARLLPAPSPARVLDRRPRDSGWPGRSLRRPGVSTPASAPGRRRLLPGTRGRSAEGFD